VIKQIVVRRYKNSGQFEKDANRQLDNGYEIIEVNGQRPKVAIVKTTLHTVLTLGIGLTVGGRAHEADPVLVTYKFSGVIPEKVRRLSRRDNMSQSAQIIALLLIVGVSMALAILVLH
jgi:hypothetical protein